MPSGAGTSTRSTPPASTRSATPASTSATYPSPTATLGEYKGVEVGKREPAADDEAVDAEIEALRERNARLETVEEAAGDGDFIVMDYLGTVDGENRSDIAEITLKAAG